MSVERQAPPPALAAPALSPMMQQYQELKKRYPDYLLLFRLGDFYELFFEDAHEGAALLQITLTSRQKGEGAIPMAGIPHHAADGYIARLIRAGRKVAICEQMEAPAKGKKLVRREVVRVITPGTLTDTQYLDGAANNFLLAVHRAGGGAGRALGAALVDVSTGEFWIGEAPDDGAALLEAALLRQPAETLVARETEPALTARLTALGLPVTSGEPSWFTLRGARERLAAHFRAPSPESLGLEGMSAGIQAAGAALAYVQETQGESLGHITRLQLLAPGDALMLDPTAVATLELFERAQDRSARGSMLAVLDRTVTPMGARTLRQWLLRPLVDVEGITRRQDAVAALVAEPARRAALRQELRGIGDLERLSSRAALGVAHARDLTGLRGFLGRLTALRGALTGVTGAPLLAALSDDVTSLPALHKLLEDALEDEPPLTLREGGLIRETWSAELGEIRRGAREARAWIASLEGRERERTGIPTLRVRFNRVFGYGIEVSHAHTAKVPAEYIRRQTLVGAERYVTTELKEYESRVLGAEERMARLELELFGEIRAAVAAEAPALGRTARAVGSLDALASLADLAHDRGHVRPTIDRDRILDIADGRHPVLEAVGEGPFTPNDLHLDPDAGQVIILTGPNMSGKSVYMRQAALLVILAQMGAFVPARAARIGIVDRILTRVGAQDNLARGQSTFLVEMVETASILHHATARSLILLDEVGRGTSTFDGLAIAWAVTEELHERGKGAKVLFATHYHELTALAETLSRVRNFHVAVKEWNDEIIFLHKVRPGGTDRSYGIQVARLAGLPPAVIARARQILAELESLPPATTTAAGEPAGSPPAHAQLGLFPHASDPLLKELAALDVSALTPLQALNLLADWQQRLKAAP
ncbi:MAG TPA: DNA mismatch repair protein MutS [Candidatus Bathyarchaeia archaeon]|nr:DNA mismatch repair protein MutS [Candidatus Bathyarchaeia archaeon]